MVFFVVFGVAVRIAILRKQLLLEPVGVLRGRTNSLGVSANTDGFVDVASGHLPPNNAGDSGRA